MFTLTWYFLFIAEYALKNGIFQRFYTDFVLK